MLLKYLNKKEKIIKYCFWCLNNHFNIENFSEPLFEKEIKVEGLYIKWYNKERKLRKFNGTISKINLLQGLKTFSIYNSEPKIIKEEVQNLICEVFILHSFEKIDNISDWIIGKHGLLKKNEVSYPEFSNSEGSEFSNNRGKLLFLPNENKKIEETGGEVFIKFQALIFEDINPERKVNLKSKHQILLNERLPFYFDLNEYKLYQKYKRNKFKKNIKEKVFKVLKAEFFNLHWINLTIDDNKIYQKKFIKPKSQMMDYITNEIITRGSVLDNFKNHLTLSKPNFSFFGTTKNYLWDEECKTIISSYFFNLDNNKVSTVNYLKFKEDVKFVKFSVLRKDFVNRLPPKDLNLPFVFNIFTFNDLIFIYPDLSLTVDFIFLFEFIIDMGITTLLKHLKEIKNFEIFIPSFTSYFFCNKEEILTVNKYGIFDYEGGIHEISEFKTFPLISEFNNKTLILNKPFFCIKDNNGYCIGIITNPQNPFKSKKQERYMWAKHPKIAKKWTKKYGSFKKKKKEKKEKMSEKEILEKNFELKKINKNKPPSITIGENSNKLSEDILDETNKVYVNAKFRQVEKELKEIKDLIPPIMEFERTYHQDFNIEKTLINRGFRWFLIVVLSSLFLTLSGILLVIILCGLFWMKIDNNYIMYLSLMCTGILFFFAGVNLLFFYVIKICCIKKNVDKISLD